MLVSMYENLQARRMDLGHHLTEELAKLRSVEAADGAGDSADAAFETSCGEVSSRLAEWDAQELRQIERALVRVKQGRYGRCEGSCPNCRKRIPLARLKALPYTTLCINCERELEKRPGSVGLRKRSHWDRVCDLETPRDYERTSFSELAIGVSRNCWD